MIDNQNDQKGYLLELSIVIPVYKSEAIILETVKQTLNVVRSNNIQFEIILINDGSPDNSWEVIKELAHNNVEVKSISLAKNFGQHNAIMCGFKYASGEYVITMDDDLQNPPEETLILLDAIKNSEHDLIFGKFRIKEHDSYRKLGSKFIGYLNEKVFKKPKSITLTNFRIAKNELIQRVLTHKTAYPYIPGLLLIYASSIGNVMVEHRARSHGASNYTMSKIMSLVGRLLINYSSYPLRFLSGLGIMIAMISFIVGSIYLLRGLMFGSEVAGWTTLVVLVSFLGGFIIALLGLIGEYLSRILDQLSTENSYFVKEVIE